MTNSLKTWWQNHHVQSILIAIGFVIFILITLYFLTDTIILDNIIEIGGILTGLFALFFPKHMHHYLTFDSEKPYSKKEEIKMRIGGIVLILLSIGFYIFDTYFYDKFF